MQPPGGTRELLGVRNGKVGRWVWIRAHLLFVPREEKWKREYEHGCARSHPRAARAVYRIELMSEPFKPQVHPDAKRPS